MTRSAAIIVLIILREIVYAASHKAHGSPYHTAAVPIPLSVLHLEIKLLVKI